jgi:lipopolysaccharide transport system permease protein
MYASPVIYSLDTVKLKKPEYYNYIAYNPISPILDTFRKSVLGGVVDYGMLVYSLIVSIVVLFLGMLIFSRTEKSFIDTV